MEFWWDVRVINSGGQGVCGERKADQFGRAAFQAVDLQAWSDKEFSKHLRNLNFLYDQIAQCFLGFKVELTTYLGSELLRRDCYNQSAPKCSWHYCQATMTSSCRLRSLAGQKAGDDRFVTPARFTYSLGITIPKLVGRAPHRGAASHTSDLLVRFVFTRSNSSINVIKDIIEVTQNHDAFSRMFFCYF